MKTNHTPGPWHIGQSETHEPAIHNSDGDCVAVACDLMEGEAEANARLISNAPTLLACLGMLLAIAETPGDYSEAERLETFDDCAKVIAESYGETTAA